MLMTPLELLDKAMGVKSATSRGGISTEAYARGFLDGQLVVYCEQINRGARLAAEINCEKSHLGRLTALIEQEGCRYLVDEFAEGRASLWIYKHELVRNVIEHLQVAPQNEAGIRSMGQLLGYADSEITRFIEDNRTVTSVSG
jgi:hypothetical protein